MTAQTFAATLLRWRLWLAACGPVACGAAVLCVAGTLALAWLLPQRALQQQRQHIISTLATLPQPGAGATPALVVAPVSADDNLALFYATLGERRYAEQQLKTLFALAAKTGLVLSQGEYQGAFEQNGHFHTYRVNLPVKGNYGAIWQFALLALRAIPFASLDDISFRRENIGEPAVEARVRLTLYLADPATEAAR